MYVIYQIMVIYQSIFIALNSMFSWSVYICTFECIYMYWYLLGYYVHTYIYINHALYPGLIPGFTSSI